LKSYEILAFNHSEMTGNVSHSYVQNIKHIEPGSGSVSKRDILHVAW